jgi:hypothetical protein
MARNTEYTDVSGARRSSRQKEPPDGGALNDMEARVKALETHIEYVRSDLTTIKSDVRELRTIHDRDFRLIFGALIAATLGLATLILGLAGLMAKGFKWL